MRQYYFLLFLLLAFDCLPLRAQTRKWTQLHPTNSPSARMGHGMAPIGDDKVILFGGQLENYDSDETWIFDLSDNDWTKVDCEEHPRACEFPAFCKIDSNKVLLFGGSWDNDIYYDETWLFDLDSMKWTQMHPAKSPHSRNRGIGAYLGDGKVLIFGGVGCEWNNDICDDFCSDTWIYDLKTNTWDSVAYCFPYGRELPQACELDSGKIFLFGGHTFNKDIPDHFVYDLNAKKWSFLYPEQGTYNRGASAIVNLDGDIFMVFGGYCRASNGKVPPTTGSSEDTWLFDFEKQKWQELDLSEHPGKRVFHNISFVTKKKAILFGGNSDGKIFEDSWLFELTSSSVQKKENPNQTIRINVQKDLIEILSSENYSLISELSIYNIYGSEVDPNNYRVSSHNPQKTVIEINQLNSGIYFLELILDRELVRSKIVIAK
ncbi:MAG: kelch repeat-containing protein [Chloroflexota bacterium]